MKLFRFFYIDESGLASLHAQLVHGEIGESTIATEHTHADKKSLKLSFFSLFGAADWEGARAAKEATTRKLKARAENMLTEICASLRATGDLDTTFSSAVAKTRSTGEPAWFYGREQFRVPQFAAGTALLNKDRAIVFESGSEGYDSSDHYYKHVPGPRVIMSASLFKFPGARDGQLGDTSHEALFFRQFVNSPVSLLVFGSVYCAAEIVQIKPLALSA
jgi:hypothetical protein